ncbi:3946_t:CDS:2 [Funneliformis geosporum]|uniref:DNA-directed DNA polymerase n=1 Tax=Funneliformis geosporum TaxID=1117311 RepID=A0A9W4WWC9_9GLOM|nr:3946_t:CDS:2 [Funneliformis geosporum]
MHTASDDLNCQYYYHKIACEKRLSLSSWTTLSNYFHEYIQGGTYLFQASVDNYNPTSEHDYNNPLLSSTLSRDRTLILTWDIKIYDSQKTGEMSNAKYNKNKVFMICITIHWKDDPEPLKRICLVNVEKHQIHEEKSSFAYYLKECNLNNKVDLLIHRMNKYYEMALKETNNTTAEQIHEIAEYYIIDALSCQRLMIKNESEQSLSASAWRKGILTSTISEKTETKYFQRLENKHPVTGLDFASLYLSLIMTYNLYPNKIILSQKHAESLREHNNVPEKKGLYDIILEYLSSRRNEIKKRLTPLKERKEDMELVIGLMDAEQNTLQVFMNTFYGMAGDNKSSFFLRKLAGGITSARQRNNKLVTNFVKRKRFGIKYGDTNSLYLICPEECFQKLKMEKLRVKANVFFKKDNESSYLKRTYEKVLFLVVFTGKKKYYESMRKNNTHTLKRVVENVLKETVRDISQIDLNGVVKTTGLTPDPYRYQIPEPDERFEYVVAKYNSSKKVGTK